ncbi:hypothetical protein AAMO2058_001589600 [Amorphochlora amoebiformis]
MPRIHIPSRSGTVLNRSLSRAMEGRDGTNRRKKIVFSTLGLAAGLAAVLLSSTVTRGVLTNSAGTRKAGALGWREGTGRLGRRGQRFAGVRQGQVRTEEDSGIQIVEFTLSSDVQTTKYDPERARINPKKAESKPKDTDIQPRASESTGSIGGFVASVLSAVGLGSVGSMGAIFGGVCVGGACQLGAGALGSASVTSSISTGLAGLGLGISIFGNSADFSGMEAVSSPYYQIANSGKPAVVEIYSHRCKICRETLPMVTQMAKSHQKDLMWVMLDGEEPSNQDIVQSFQVDSIPHFVFFNKAGAIQGEAVGKVTEEVMRANIEALTDGSDSLPYPAFAKCDNQEQELKMIHLKSALRKLQPLP